LADDDARLDSAEARRFATAVLESAGSSRDDAAHCSDLLVESSLRGVDSHGVVALLPLFAEQARAGVGGPGTAPATVERRGAVALVEGGGASGPRAARYALSVALDLARASGVGAVTARGISYLGALAWSVLPAAEQGFVGLAMVNSVVFVAPYGGREALHGTNPIAAAIPCDPDPIVLDMRTNAFRMADYFESLRTGGPLPADALLGPDGTPVADARELDAGAWDSAVSLPAGVKGYGLALLVDVLTAGLAGSAIGREVGSTDEPARLAAFFLALEPSFFGPSDRLGDAVQRLAEQARTTAPLDPAKPVLLPGERSAAERRRRLELGIPVDEGLWNRLGERLAELELGVPLPRLER
jgi:LDH2 family malate/lactate/ureidoglycolate dehydrogenase